MQAYLRQKIGDAPLALLTGLAAYGSAEIAVRLVRLVTVVVIARQLAPDIVGIAALTLTAFELMRVLANVGVGQKIIAADADRLGATCNTAHHIFWIWCSAIAGLQLIAALIMATVFAQPLAGAMLAVLSGVYLLMPGGLVQCYLLMREGRAGTTARTTATQTIADHLLTAALLLAWQSPWSVVLPKLLTAPIWLLMTRRARPWRPDPAAGRVPVRELLGFGLSVLATELLTATRGQADKIIISATLGITALGTWYFAFNAGIGIISSLITAFGTVMFPGLCAVPTGRARSQRLRTAILLGSLIFLPAVAVQSLLAPWYVPIIFGQHWAHAAPLISLLCLAGVPMLMATITTAWLRAEGKANIDAMAGVVITTTALGALAIGVQSGQLVNGALFWVFGLAASILPFAALILWPALTASRAPLSKENFA